MSRARSNRSPCCLRSVVVCGVFRAELAMSARVAVAHETKTSPKPRLLAVVASLAQTLGAASQLGWRRCGCSLGCSRCRSTNHQPPGCLPQRTAGSSRTEATESPLQCGVPASYRSAPSMTAVVVAIAMCQARTAPTNPAMPIFRFVTESRFHVTWKSGKIRWEQFCRRAVRAVLQTGFVA